MVEFTTVLSLLVYFQFKHLVCDYFLQGEYMLGKFKKKGWVGPLAAHCGVQAMGTYLVCMLLNPVLTIPLMLIDFILHFLTDRWKVICSNKVTHEDKEFWWLLGIDQAIHHLTNYGIIAAILLW